MAKITITIEDVSDVEIGIWLKAMEPLKKGIIIKSGVDSDELLEFWKKYYDYLDKFNHAKDANLVAVNIPQFIQVMKKYSSTVPARHELLTMFKNNRSGSYLGCKTVRSLIIKKSLKCWVFDRGVIETIIDGGKPSREKRR